MNPDSSFEEISSNCFSDQIGKYNFRNIPISRQPYQKLFKLCSRAILKYHDPYEDYIPLEEDCSNIDEVIEIMNDEIELKI